MPLEHGEIKFSENKALLFTQYKNYFYFCILTAVTDAVSTVYFMSLLGPESEFNFLIKKLSYHYGIYLGPLLGKLYQLFALWGLSVMAPRLTRFLCLFIISLNLFATGMNFVTFLYAYYGIIQAPGI